MDDVGEGRSALPDQSPSLVSCSRRRPAKPTQSAWRPQVSSSASGCRHRRPGKREKSRSVVIHSAPFSIATAAR